MSHLVAINNKMSFLKYLDIFPFELKTKKQNTFLNIS